MKLNWRLMEAVKPDDMPPASGGETVGATDALEDEALFADLATHDEYAEPEPVVEPTPTTSEGAPATNTDATPAVEATPPAAVIPPPTAGEPAAATPPVQAAKAPSTTEQPTPASAAATENLPATAREPEPVDFEKHRAAVLPKLEELYKLTDEEAEAARVSPETALPKLAARLHFEATTAAFNSVMGVLPNLVDTVLTQRKAIQESEDRFYSRWGDLKKPEYEATVLNSVRAYKAANPKAPLDEVIERAGLMAMLTLGLSPSQQQPPAAPTPPSPPMRPASPAGAGFSSQPFQPASSSEPQDDIQALIAAELAGQI